MSLRQRTKACVRAWTRPRTREWSGVLNTRLARCCRHRGNNCSSHGERYVDSQTCTDHSARGDTSYSWRTSNSRCLNNASVSVAMSLKNSSIEASSCRVLVLVDTVAHSAFSSATLSMVTLVIVVRNGSIRAVRSASMSDVEMAVSSVGVLSSGVGYGGTCPEIA